MKLNIANVSQRGSISTTERCLLTLEYDSGSDRVRRVFYDRVSMVVVWKVTPWGRIILLSAIFVLPGLLLQLADAAEAHYIGAGLIVFGIAADLRYAYCRKTWVAILRDGESRKFQVIARPGKVRAFVEELCRQIRAVQQLPTELAVEASRPQMMETEGSAGFDEASPQSNGG